MEMVRKNKYGTLTQYWNNNSPNQQRVMSAGFSQSNCIILFIAFVTVIKAALDIFLIPDKDINQMWQVLH